MKKGYIINIIKQVVCWILLLQVINISINPPEFRYERNSATLQMNENSINEIESVYELISEGVFDEDVPESDEDDIATSSRYIELYFSAANSIKILPIEFPLEHFSNSYNHIPSVSKEPLYQPPRLV